MLRHQTNQLLQDLTGIPAQKNFQKYLFEIKLRYQNTRQYPVLTVTKNIEKNLPEKVKVRRAEPTLQRTDPMLQLSENL